MPINITLSGTGKFLPKLVVTSEDLDLRLNKKLGWVQSRSGVLKRHFASENETTSFMAAEAAKNAIFAAGINATDLDCIISASGGMEQAIPNTSSLIQQKLGLENSGITTFDINSTCLSFLSAFDVSSSMLETNRFNTILIVSSEIPSFSMNWQDMETCTIFGDGAAAVILQKSPKNNLKILSSQFATYSSGFEYCQVKSGGTKFHPSKSINDFTQNGFFEMNGKSVYKTVADKMDGFLEKLFTDTNLTLKDIDLVIPHQASRMAISYLIKKLNIAQEKLVNIFPSHGNQVAASIPTALHEALINNKIRDGNKVLLIGTSAGISIGGMIIEFKI